jgi:hypothetical protein
MPMQKKSINKAQKNVKKPAGSRGATRLSGKSLASTKQMNLTMVHPVDKSSPTHFLNCANG